MTKKIFKQHAPSSQVAYFQRKQISKKVLANNGKFASLCVCINTIKLLLVINYNYARAALLDE